MGDFREDYEVAVSEGGYSDDAGSYTRPQSQSVIAPQAVIDTFWRSFNAENLGKISQILPDNPYALSKSASEPKGAVTGRPARDSYEEAKADCIKAVEKISKECRRVNTRYRDPHFDIEWDLKTKKFDCLLGLTKFPDRIAWAGSPKVERPRAVKRVYQIFDKPQFYINGPSTVDIRQGVAMDCWFLAALGALGNRQDLELIQRICVKQDEVVGVYGFVFHRDGEWISVVIDDKLYLKHADLDESRHEMEEWNRMSNRVDSEEEYRKTFQAGSRALFFAQCVDQNETWLPLLEKAFAKAHGDYGSINGGYTGEAIEDLTGGVTTELFISDILDINKFWTDELMRVNKEFLFGCATGRFDDWQGDGKVADRKGIQARHAYSIMEAREEKGHKLLKIRNPWGETEWSGRWSDGSAEWDAEWLQRLNHKFGDDGVFWISYDDWRRKYHFLDRTRLLTKDWVVTKQWTSLQVPWAASYNGTRFTIEIEKAGPVVVVLSQLDDRYWMGFRGQYRFSLHFRINEAGKDDYIVRSHGNYCMNRSVSTELDLVPGVYDVRMKIQAVRDSSWSPIYEVVREKIHTRQEKMVQVAMNYDLAHAKGIVRETEEEKKRLALQRETKEAKIKAERIARAKELKRKDYDINVKGIERGRRDAQRRADHYRKKAQKEHARLVKERAYHHGHNQPQSPRTHIRKRQASRHRRSREDEDSGDGGREHDWVDEDYADRGIYRADTDDPRASARPNSSADTIYTWNSSVDSDLDQDLFEELQDKAAEDDYDQAEYHGDSWNAVCVVGLRVFTKTGDARIKVVRQGDGHEEEISNTTGEAVQKGGVIAPLDIDDQARPLSEDIVTPISASDKKGISQLPIRPRRENSDGEKKIDSGLKGLTRRQSKKGPRKA